MTTITEAQFRRASARAKGWLVYMFGEREDQPNVPKRWHPPTERSRREYERGFNAACMSMLDCDDD